MKGDENKDKGGPVSRMKLFGNRDVSMLATQH
jgi:hypothetical protein